MRVTLALSLPLVSAAVLALLYGCGLRISEALAIRRDEAPVGRRDSVTVKGKGGKVRTLPVIAPVQKAVADYLREVVEYVLAQTDAVARNLDMVSLPHLYKRTGESALIAVQAWKHTVLDTHPAYVRTMRGHNPPQFLEERARVAAVVEKVRAKREAARRATTA